MNEVARPMPRPTAQVARYVEVLGVDLAMQFILQFGGAELYLPKEPRGKSEAEKLLESGPINLLERRVAV